MMIFINAVYKEEVFSKEYQEGFVKMFSCICPFVGEELWEILGHKESIANEEWPKFDEAKCIDDEIEIPVQVNGRVKAKIMITLDEAEDSVKEKAREALKAEMGDINIVKEIYVPKKIVNVVVK